MARIQRFDHVGITVADLDAVTAFFVGLGLEVEGTRMFVEGEFLDTVIGIPDSRTEIVMLRPPDGGTRPELSSFVRPEPGNLRAGRARRHRRSATGTSAGLHLEGGRQACRPSRHEAGLRRCPRWASVQSAGGREAVRCVSG